MRTDYTHGPVTWVDLTTPTVEEIAAVAHAYNLDPRIAEELAAPSFKPRASTYNNALYLVLNFPTLRGTTLRGETEIDFVVGTNFLITARYEQFDPLHVFAKSFEVETLISDNAHRTNTHGGHLFATMLTALYQSLTDHHTLVRRRLSEVEDRVFSGNERQMVMELSHIGRTVFDTRQALAPHRAMLESLRGSAVRLLGEPFSHHIDTIIGSYEHTVGLYEQLRGALYELRETNNSLLTIKQNEIVQRLTIFSFIFAPISFIAFIFSMDAKMTPIVGAQNDFWIIIGIMGVVALGTFSFFKYHKWL